MEQVRQLTARLMAEHSLLQATLSNTRRKDSTLASKVQIKPIELQGKPQYQFISTVGPKVLHQNLDAATAATKLVQLIEADYKQALFQAVEADYQILANKPAKPSILKKPASKTSEQVELSHNRLKNYVLNEGEAVPFLVELGVMNANGKVLAAKYDKFRQINRFLELIRDVTPYLRKDKRLEIIDFGCGKSYLTFALYHYLVHELQLDVQMVGLDLKADVIAHCSGLADKLGYAQLRFEVGDINHYDKARQVDMVVTLHACDTATDAALEKAVRWNADVILSVPCCQHELMSQMDSPVLAPMLQHGIIKERFAALATDALRAQLLELAGYKTQILEFIDMEHTPKNLLIRSVKRTDRETNPTSLAAEAEKARAYLTLKQLLNVQPYLEQALKDRLTPLFQPLND